MRDSSILVTGASGFVGARLVRELVERGARVTGISRAERPAWPGLDWIRCDLTDAEAVDRAFERARPELVFHLGSWVSGRRELEHVRTAFHANLETAVHLLVAASRAGCRRIVLAGSMEEPDLTAGEVPGSPYAAAKAAQSLYAGLFHSLFSAPVVVARIFMVYGPGQSDLTKLVPYTILEGLAGRAARITSGHRPIDWIFVEDVARGLVACAEAPHVEGSTLDLGSGTAVTVGTMATEIAARLGAPPPELGALADRPLEAIRRADPERTFARTGFRPEIGLGDGLDQTIRWYRAERAAGRL